MKIIIIGGVAGGASAAARLRRLDEKCEIIIFERTNFVSYATCGLPYYIGDVITDDNQLTVQTPESFKRRFNIDVRTNHEVIDIDKNKKEVLVKNLITNEEFIESFDKLILATGSKPILPSFYKESDKVFTLRTVEDSKKIKSYIYKNNIKSAAIIGAGYIGIELAENLRNLNMDVNVIDANDQVLSILDKDIVSFVHTTLKKNGIKLNLDQKVEDIIIDDDKVITVLSNEKIASDIVVVAVGVKPESILAKKVGLELGLKDSIKVDEYMRTSIEDIYAVGDAVEVNNLISNTNSLISLAGPASKQGRIAADNIFGINSSYAGSIGTSILKIFDLNVASVGINEKECINKGIKYEKVILSPLNHAGYYPNANVLTIKLIYNKSSLNILGAQLIGADGVDKRIDVIATAIKAKMKAIDLAYLELAYAPPFSSSKDPINLAGFIVENIENGLVKQFYYEDIDNLRKDPNVILLDTRTPLEYGRGFAEGFINIPLDNLRERINELDKSKKIYVMCQSGLRSYLATRILVQNGFDAYNFVGGYRLYNSIYREFYSYNE
ncbi:MAG: CoA-disulfide reductase [Erysipelotrichaceae bacterium]|nr:CoA-disulfide reductase [Erysipelotrichaceae bacterium]